MIFQTIIENSTSAEALETFIEDNLLDLTYVSDARFEELSEEKNEIDQFILQKIDVLCSLDFSKEDNRFFVLFLLDLCERLDLSSLHTLYNDVIRKFNIPITKRMEAILSFSLGISSNEQYIERFEEICTLLNEVYEEEEYNQEKVIATFFNYYIIVLDIHPQYIIRLKEKITKAIEKEQFIFLFSTYINELLSYDTNNPQDCTIKIHQLKDRIFDRGKLPVHTTKEPKIEKETDYTDKLEKAQNLIDEINTLAWNVKGKEDIYIGSGVEILKEEKKLFEYIRRHWNMHKEKIKSGIRSLLPKLKEEDEDNSYHIIDWGCGQGIATLVLIDYMQKNGLHTITDRIKKITLIELGEPALSRASLHINKFFPQYSDRLETILADLNELKAWDFAHKEKDCIYIHLFSNILDIIEINLSSLIDLITKVYKGQNHFICTSPYIGDWAASRFNGFYKEFEKKYPESFTLHACKNNSKGGIYNEYWLCNNQYKGISDSHSACLHKGDFYDKTTGCKNKWARILRAFSVKID